MWDTEAPTTWRAMPPLLRSMSVWPKPKWNLCDFGKQNKWRRHRAIIFKYLWQAVLLFNNIYEILSNI